VPDDACLNAKPPSQPPNVDPGSPVSGVASRPGHRKATTMTTTPNEPTDPDVRPGEPVPAEPQLPDEPQPTDDPDNDQE
jgi:hypothetical protein